MGERDKKNNATLFPVVTSTCMRLGEASRCVALAANAA